MNSLHRDVLYKLFEFVPDIRAFGCVCKWSRNEADSHPDMLYWRGGTEREMHLTAKIYNEFKCANTYQLIKYDRADIFAAHCDARSYKVYIDSMITFNSREIIKHVASELNVLQIHHHIDKIKTTDQYRFLQSQFKIFGSDTAVFELVRSGNTGLLLEICRGSPGISAEAADLALEYGSPATMLELIAAEIVEPRRVHMYAIDNRKYWLIDILFRAGKGMVVPEDIVPDVISEMTPPGLTALAAVQDITDHINMSFDRLSTNMLSLVPTALRLGAAPSPENTADFIEYAAKHGNLEAVLALRMYIKNASGSAL